MSNTEPISIFLSGEWTIVDVIYDPSNARTEVCVVPVPTPKPPPKPMTQTGPHSRACTFYPHVHGTSCNVSCPTCGGRPR